MPDGQSTQVYRVKANDYRSPEPGAHRQGRPFKEWDDVGFTVIEPLTFLYGRPWDDLALGYVHAIRPSHLRVIDGGSVQMDAQAWRVTVFVDESGLITSIEQEVEVGLPDGIDCGDELDSKLREGL